MTPVPVVLQDRRKVRTIVIPPFMHIRSREVDWTYLTRTRILHSHLFDDDLCLEVARRVGEAGGGFSLDVELHRIRDLAPSRFERLLRRTKWLFLNSETLDFLQPGLDPVEGARRLKEKGAGTVVVTLGPEGSLAVSGLGKAVRVPAPTVPVVDGTGAGDGFAAAFFYGILKKWPLAKTLAYASASAACVVQHIGARTGQPRLKEFLNLGDECIKKHEQMKKTRI